MSNIDYGDKNTFQKLVDKIKSKLASVAFSGKYSDLEGKPTIPAAVRVKGDNENLYRTGDVNLSPENIGAFPEIEKISGANADNILEPGFYYLVAPVGTSLPVSSNGWLLVMNLGYGEGDLARKQIFWSYNGNVENVHSFRSYMREKTTSGVWGTWHRYAMVDDLDSYVPTTSKQLKTYVVGCGSSSMPTDPWYKIAECEMTRTYCDPTCVFLIYQAFYSYSSKWYAMVKVHVRTNASPINQNTVSPDIQYLFTTDGFVDDMFGISISDITDGIRATVYAKVPTGNYTSWNVAVLSNSNRPSDDHYWNFSDNIKANGDASSVDKVISGYGSLIASKVGTSTVGNVTRPIYLDNGNPTPIGNRLELVDGSTLQDVLTLIDDGDGNINYGGNLIITANGNTFIGGGESPLNLYNALKTALKKGENFSNNGENMNISSDNIIQFFTNCQTIGSRKGMAFTYDGSLIPISGTSLSLGTSENVWENAYINNAHADYVDGNISRARMLVVYNPKLSAANFTIEVTEDNTIRFSSYNGVDTIFEFGISDMILTLAGDGGLNLKTNNSVKVCWGSSFRPILASAFTVSSSIRYKENVEDMEESEAEKILSLRPVRYDYKEKYGGKKQFGFIAEEVIKEIPHAVLKNKNGQPDSVDYSKFVTHAIKKIQMQQNEIDGLKNSVSKLERKNEEFNKRMEVLEKMLNL